MRVSEEMKLNFGIYEINFVEYGVYVNITCN